MNGYQAGAFYELRIADSASAHKKVPPSSLVNVRLWSREADGYAYRSKYRLLVDKPMTANLRLIQERLERARPAGDRSLGNIRDAVEAVMPALRRLRAGLDDWSEQSKWLQQFASTFHNNLKTFSFIAATDRLGPETWLNPRYIDHAGIQFRHRRQRSLRSGNLLFSKFVFEAINRTGWLPNVDNVSDEPEMKVELRVGFQDDELEIVRILFWNEQQLRERQIADMVDRYHTLFAVPVFVLDPRHAKTVVPDVDEYLIGLDRRGNTHTAYGLTRGTVRSLAVDEGNNLFQHFCDLLGHPELRALQQLRASRPA